MIVFCDEADLLDTKLASRQLHKKNYHEFTNILFMHLGSSLSYVIYKQ